MSQIELDPDDARLLWLPQAARADRYAGTFGGQHVKALKKLGVDAAQLALLEPVLRIIRLYSEPAPKLAEVREHIEEVEETTRAALRALHGLLSAPDTEGAREEARQRLRQASWRLDSNGLVEEPLDRMASMLRDLLAVAEKAIGSTPEGQTRAVAHTYPIAYIDTALRVGFKVTWKMVPIEQRKPFPFVPAAADGSAFRKVATVCYTAAGVATSDPLRAIRAYLAEMKNSSSQN